MERTSDESKGDDIVGNGDMRSRSEETFEYTRTSRRNSKDVLIDEVVSPTFIVVGMDY
ncbi:hypothetical protein OCU04_002468 [Sclerotinia nivalis]|uniref:Uncharacterized protein n=1 Tax=Sclerotinia nivalis TaxID=352851 RepID=A0A9X0ATN7_9HELO|nr:hypothetical protein OCU04_002468 [Sclerotinia nivalis]